MSHYYETIFLRNARTMTNEFRIRKHSEHIWKLWAVCNGLLVYSVPYYIFVKQAKHYVAYRTADFSKKKKSLNPFLLLVRTDSVFCQGISALSHTSYKCPGQ
jgi:hypothetical protein